MPAVRVPTAAIAVAAVALSRAALGLPTALGAPVPRLRDMADRAAAFGRHASDGRFTHLPDEVVSRGTLLVSADADRGPTPRAPVPLAADPVTAACTLALTWYATRRCRWSRRWRVLADPGASGSRCRRRSARRLHLVPVPLSSRPSTPSYSPTTTTTTDLPPCAHCCGPGCAVRVPLGLGNHLRHWGAGDACRRARLGRVRPGRRPDPHVHGGPPLSARLRRNTTLWSSWVAAGQAFFGGDATPGLRGPRLRLRAVRPPCRSGTASGGP
jgi:hypothetical protein